MINKILIYLEIFDKRRKKILAWEKSKENISLREI